MGYGIKTVTMRSLEAAFMDSFFSFLGNIDINSNFTITTPDSTAVEAAYYTPDSDDPDYGSSIDKNGTTPTFTVRIDGNDNICTLVFERKGPIYARTGWGDTSGFKITATTANQEETEFNLFFNNTSISNHEEATRTFKIKYIINSECLYLGLGDYDDDFNSLSWIFFEIKINGGITARTMMESSPSSNILNGDFISTSGIVGKRVDRLPYVYDTLNYYSIEKINKKVFIAESTNYKAFEVNTLHDVTWITPNLNITINGTNYYSLDNHTIMEI